MEKTNGLRGKDESFKVMIFTDSSTGFLFGDYVPNVDFDKTQAIIYKTIDAGKTWTSTTLGKGSFEKAIAVNDTLFAFTWVGSEHTCDSTILYASYDKGKDWQELAKFPGCCRDIAFVNSRLGFISKEVTQGGEQLLKTTDGGFNWLPCYSSVNRYGKLIIIQDTLFFSGFGLATMNVNDCKIEYEKYPKEFKEGLKVKDNNNKIWILGSIQNQLIFLERESTNKFNQVPFNEFKENSDASIDDYRIWDSNITVLSGKINEKLLGGFGGVEYKFYISEDKGKNWLEEKIPSPIHGTPIAYYGKNKMRIYANGSIQRRD